MTDISLDSGLDLDACLRSPIDWTLKSSPSAGEEALTIAEVAGKGWNLLREDLMFPCAVLKQSALRHNGQWMRRYLAATGALIAPHGKTSMSPQLFDMQLRDGAWAMTAATAAHVRIYRRFGVSRILMANQLVGRQNIAFVLGELRRDPGFDFYCLVDSIEGVVMLEEDVAASPIGRPLQVLVEVGIVGGRTGARSAEAALAVARRAAMSPYLSLRGVECFEGIIKGDGDVTADDGVALLTRLMAEVARAALREDLFADGPVILTAGGSAFFDIVARGLGDVELTRPTQVVLRSGCYLTHDSGFYRDLVADLQRRDPTAKALGDLQPALEIWTTVQSRPEPDRVVVSLGKRDAPYDVRFPTPLYWFRTGMAAPEALSDEYLIIRLDDQHGYMSIPPEGPVCVGDLIGFGVSHPCGAFDRWPALFIVDDDYDVTSAVKTYF